MNGAALNSYLAAWFGALGERAVEASLLALLVFLVVRGGRRLSSPVRHGLVVIVLLKFVLPTVPAPWALPSLLPTFVGPAVADSAPGAEDPSDATAFAPKRILPVVPESSRSASTESSLEPSALDEASLSTRGRLARVNGDHAAEVPAAGSDANARGRQQSTSPTRQDAVPARWKPDRSDTLTALLVLQVLGASALIVRRLRQRKRLRRLLAHCTPVKDTNLRAALERACANQRVRRLPTLLASPDALGPAATGLLRRAIIVPTAVLEAMPAHRLRPVIEHEVAHHRRGDLWLESLAFAGSLVWWPHPLYWLVVRELRRLREDCCDEAATARLDPGSYCQALLDVAATLGSARPALPALVHGSLSHPLGRRIRRMLNRSYRPHPALGAPALVVLFVMAAAVLPTASEGQSAARPPEPIAPAVPQGAPAPLAPLPDPDPELGTLPAPLPLPALAAPLADPTGWPLPAPAAPLADPTGWPLAVPAPDASLPSVPYALPALPASGAAFAPFVPQAGGGTSRSASTWSAAPARPSSGQWGSSRNISYTIDDGEIRLSRGAIDELIRLGIDADFAAGMRRIDDRRLSLAEVREWERHGFDPRLADEFAAWGHDSVWLSDLLRLLWTETGVDYLQGLRAIGQTEGGIEGAIQLARYDVEVDWITGFRDAGYTELDNDDLVQLRRYEVEPSYAATYREAGYELSVEDLVQLNRYEVDEDAAKRMSEAGLEKFSVSDLVQLKRYDVTDAYVRSMTENGLVNLSTDDLVQLNRYGVTPEAAKAFRDSGYDLTVSGLVQLKRYEVDPAIPARLAEMGYSDVSIDDLVTLKRYGVDLDYVAALEGLGMAELSIDDLVMLERYEVKLATLQALADAGYAGIPVDHVVTLTRYGVSPQYIRDMRTATSRMTSVSDLVQLKRYEVTPEFVGSMIALGLGDLSVDDLVRLRRYEVSADFISRLQSAGFEDLTIDRIIRLKRADG